MEHRVVATLDVPADRAWEVLADLAGWPRWTPTVESIDSAEGRPVVGAQVAIKQPRRSVAHYVVDVVEDGRRFRWGSARGGVRQVADHVLTATSATSCTLTLTFAMSGPLGTALAALGAGRIRSMLQTEADSLAVAVGQPRES